MAERPATRTEILLIGFGTSCTGLYFTLAGAGLLPLPGGPGNLHAPLWTVFCAGLVFLLPGILVLMHGAGWTGSNGEFPPDAPRWLHVMQYLIGVAIFVCFGIIASWIAFAPGPRSFSGSFSFGFTGIEGPVTALAGRIAFGIGAILIWLCTIAVAVSGARKLLRRANS